jgi:DNA replication protein DnaC
MSTRPQTLFQCPAGHQQWLPYPVATVTWCEPCRASVQCSPVPPGAAVVARASDDTAGSIQQRFREYAATYDRAREGIATALTPDPRNDREAETFRDLQTAGFPERHIAGLKSMDQAGMKDARSVHDFLAATPTPAIVILWGDYGTGKTQTATAVAMLRRERQQRTRYVTAKQLTRSIKDNFGTKVPEAELLRRYHEAQGLVIDEIQAALDEEPDRMTWARTQIQEIVDTRYARTAPLKTILICNADSIETLKSRIGGHILSRAQECGKVLRVARKNYRSQTNI